MGNVADYGKCYEGEPIKSNETLDEAIRTFASDYRKNIWYLQDELINYRPDTRKFYPKIGPKPPFPPDLKKEQSVLNDQQAIDDQVKEAIAAPRRAAEVARRVEAVHALDVLADAEVGTVLRFRRTYSKKEYTYAAIKVADNSWYVTGNSTVHSGSYVWEGLLEWMTTGENLVHEVQVANGWDALL